ncbi:hypothetical protein FHS88_003529 [Roseomonas alkaliterrae]|uniref:DUF4169 family protein n=1 Tax=Neoroseomonas alkaliterrae TaxID=1452450 RepID=A0A840XU20_9PROT|nr:hypothetical protein [Neoroseomonas alkaliterrae]MBB5691376.1 hypothetical protein [Neoroseomonas alkaliterrae]
MARKPNYGQQRADVNRAKQAKKEAKLREREEAVAKRKAGLQDREDDAPPAPGPARD